MTGTRRRYTAKEKAQAVGIAVVDGQRQAADRTGVPLSTIHSWLERPEFEQLRTEKREVVESMFWAGIQIGVKEVVDGLQGTAKLSEKAVALGILYDKFALLSGGPTAITGTVAEGLPDHEKRALRNAIDEWLKAREPA